MNLLVYEGQKKVPKVQTEHCGIEVALRARLKGPGSNKSEALNWSSDGNSKGTEDMQVTI